MDSIKVHNKRFKISIPSQQIQMAVERIAKSINIELSDKQVVFVAILNGAFLFASDVFRRITFNAEISFLKLSSYEGDTSTGHIKTLVGMDHELKGKTIVVLEDIIDTGHTLQEILKQLDGHHPAEIKIASLLFKPDACQYPFKIDYIGFEIPNDFIIGYGLDYNGLGRNLEDIYTIC